MARAGSIDVDIRANSAQFVREMQRVRRSTEGVQKQLRNFARGAAATFGVIFSAQTARNVLRVADELENFSNRIGVNARELQAWQQVALQFNVQQNQLNIGLQRLQRRAAEAAQGTGEARGALRELGIDAARFTQLNLDNQILDLAQAFEAVSGDADRTRLAFKLFDSEGVAFLQFLNEGEEALQSLRGETNTWSDETREALAEANTELAKLGDQFTILAGKTVAFIRGAGQSFLDWLRNARNSASAGVFGGRSGRNRRTGRAPPGISPVLDVLTPTRETALGGARGETGAPATGAVFAGPLQAITQATQAVQEAQRQAFAEGQNAIVEYNRRVLEEDRKLQEQLKQQREQTFAQFENLFTQNLVQAAEGGFKQILSSWVLTIQQMVAAAVSSRLFGALGNTAFGQSLGNFFGGARANGGPVMAGGAYLVGERGPEIFTPGRSGQIIPNGAGTIVQNITVNGGNRGELLAAMTVAKNAAVREVEDARRRS